MQLFPPGVPVSKRLLDLLISAIGGLIICPLTLLIGLLVWLKMGRPVLFRQMRPGFAGKPFAFIKFRTMTDSRQADGNLLPDEQRLTDLGRFLRSLSLDEIPSLINVLRGEMSLVGPRPLLMHYLALYTPEQARRHDVLPGITGWAQVNGRNALNWEDRFRLDVWYVDRWSFWLDIRILLITLWKVVKREGISLPGYATAPEFTGSDGRAQHSG
jgi:sugar transferase EpsL